MRWMSVVDSGMEKEWQLEIIVVKSPGNSRNSSSSGRTTSAGREIEVVEEEEEEDSGAAGCPGNISQETVRANPVWRSTILGYYPS